MEPILKIRDLLTTFKDSTSIKLEEFLEKSIEFVDVIEMTIGVLSADKMLIYNINYIEGIVIQEMGSKEFLDWEEQLFSSKYIDEFDEEDCEYARIYGYYDREILQGFIRFVRKNIDISNIEEIKYKIIYDQLRIVFLEK